MVKLYPVVFPFFVWSDFRKVCLLQSSIAPIYKQTNHTLICMLLFKDGTKSLCEKMHTYLKTSPSIYAIFSVSSMFLCFTLF